MANEKDINLQERLNKLLQQKAGLIKQIADAEAKQSAKAGEYVTKTQKAMKVAQDRAALAEKILEFEEMSIDERNKDLANEGKRIANLKARNLLTKEEADLQEQILLAKTQIAQNEKDVTDEMKQQLQLAIDLKDKKEEQKDAADEEKANLLSNLDTLGGMVGLTSTQTTLFGKMGSSVKSIGKLLSNSETDMADMAKNAAKLGGDLALGTVIARSEELFTLQDGIIANFRATTGASAQTATAIAGASNELRQMGLDMTSAGVAGEALYNSVTAFRTATPEAQREAAAFTGLLVELNIDANTAADAMQTLTMGMGQSLSQAQATTEELLHFANSIDVNVNEALDNFARHSDELVAHGGDVVAVFKQLQTQSRLTGISMDSLMSVAGQFDTFEGAASAVGRLNGILGGPYLNSIEMVYMTEAERLEAMKQTLEMSGRSFDSLSRYEKKALAAAGSFTSVGEAQQFFNSQLDDPKTIEAKRRQESLTDQARKMKPIMERLSLAMNKFAFSMEPVINFASRLVEGFADMSTGGKVFAGVLFIGIPMVLKMTKALMGLRLMMLQTAAAQATLGAAKGLGALGMLGLGAAGILGGGLLAAGIYGVSQMFANGTDSAPMTGAALMGEKGPELLVGSSGSRMVGASGPAISGINKGDRVITNANLKKGLGGGGPTVGAMKAAFKQALQEINSEQAAGQKKVQTGTVPVVMQVNNRELGRVVLKIIEDSNSIKLSPST